MDGIVVLGGILTSQIEDDFGTTRVIRDELGDLDVSVLNWSLASGIHTS